MHMLRKGQVAFYSKKEPQILRDFIHRFFDRSGPIFSTCFNREMVFMADQILNTIVYVICFDIYAIFLSYLPTTI